MMLKLSPRRIESVSYPDEKPKLLQDVRTPVDPRQI